MLLLPKLDRSIKEFQHTIQVPEYDMVIDKLLRKASQLDIPMSFWGESYSMAEDCETEGCESKYRIRIRRAAPSGNRKELVYDIMHEMGHCLDPLKLGLGNKGNAKLMLAREQRAWAVANEEFNLYPELQPDIAEYTEYKNSCLAEYIRRAKQSSH
jgi:hypothetical protein